MTAYQFLSDEWIAAVSDIRARAADNKVVTPGFVVNATVTGVPFGAGRLDLHSDSGPSSGWMPGHAADPRLSITIDYQLARTLIVDDVDAVDLIEQAVGSGTLQFDGEPGVLQNWWSHRVANPELLAVEAAVRGVTL